MSRGRAPPLPAAGKPLAALGVKHWPCLAMAHEFTMKLHVLYQNKNCLPERRMAAKGYAACESKSRRMLVAVLVLGFMPTVAWYPTAMQLPVLGSAALSPKWNLRMPWHLPRASWSLH